MLFIIIIIGALIVLISWFIIDEKRSWKRYTIHEEWYKKIFKISKDAKLEGYKDGLGFSWPDSYINNCCYLWVDSENFYIVPDPGSEMRRKDFPKQIEKYKKVIIPLRLVEYFYIEGEQLTMVRGEGGGASIGGAIVGNVIAGPVGAVIGGRKEVNIQTEIVDQRAVVIRCNTDKIKELRFSMHSYRWFFMKNMPDKEYRYVMYRNR